MRTDGRTDGQADRHNEVNFRSFTNCLKPIPTILKVLHRLNVHEKLEIIFKIVQTVKLIANVECVYSSNTNIFIGRI